MGELTLGDTARCVVTLIRPQVALTAAHCLWPPFTGEESARMRVTFASAEERRTFGVRRAHSFDPRGAIASSSGFNQDLALLELTAAVPSSLAQPRAIAAEPVAIGARVTLVGRGSCVPSMSVGDQSLRSFPFDPAAVHRSLCPGDSGAPLLAGNAGAPGSIVGVASGYASTACAADAPDRMLFGDAVGLRAAVQAQLLRWLREP